MEIDSSASGRPSEAFVYGSWAPTASDRLADVAARARERLGIVVNIHRATPDAWAHPQGNPFLTTVAGRPAVPLIDNRGAERFVARETMA